MKIGESLYDEKGNALRIVRNIADGKILLIDLSTGRVVGELYTEQLIYSDDEVYIV